MEGYNYQIAYEIYIESLKRRLSETIADMIVNQVEKSEFIYVNFQKYDNIFTEVARLLNCDIEYIEEKYISMEQVVSKKYMLHIQPSNIFNNVRTKMKVFMIDDTW